MSESRAEKRIQEEKEWREESWWAPERRWEEGRKERKPGQEKRTGKLREVEAQTGEAEKMKRNALIEQIKTYICPFLSLSQKHLYKCAFSHSLISPNTCCHSTFNIIFLREQKGESRHLLSLPDMSDIQGGEAVLTVIIPGLKDLQFCLDSSLEDLMLVSFPSRSREVRVSSAV